MLSPRNDDKMDIRKQIDKDIKMQLFEIDSVEDLICRGYKSTEILELKQVDTGYNNNKYKTALKNIDRLNYKYNHLEQRFTIHQLKSYLEKYNDGLTKKEFLDLLLIHDYHGFNLKKAFDYLNLSEEFKLADKNNKLNYWKKGTIEKYGVDNVFKLKEFQDKAAETREKRYGGRYTLSKGSSLEPSARQNSIETNKSEESKKKRIQTNIKKYGVPYTSQSEIIRKKTEKTNLSKYGFKNAMQSKDVQNKVVKTNMEKYGVKSTLQLDSVKEKIKETNLQRYGVPNYQQTAESREKQSKKMIEIKSKILQTKIKNRTLRTSKPEQNLHQELLNLFDNVQTQFDSNEYPFACDFYIPDRQLYIELNASWTHNSAWYDENKLGHNEIANKWSNSSAYYKQAHKTWTYYDVKKRQTAKENNLNYLVFWQPDLSDFYLWVELGCPDAKDWEREYSWLDSRQLPTQLENNQLTPLKNGSKTIIKIARQFMYPVIYEREINMWNQNIFIKNKGYIQPFLFANRLKYINKTPDQLNNLDIIRGLSYSGQIRAYTAFDNSLMKRFIEKYKPQSIFDPCSGWGERLLTAASYNIPYRGQDINKKLKEPYQKLIDSYKLTNQSVTIVDSSKTKNEADCLFTCPPYFDTEIYTKNGAENLNYDDFIKWWDTIIKNSDVNIVAFQINQKYKKVLKDVVTQNGYQLVEEMKLTKQASHLNKSKKEYESLMILRKI